MNPIKVLSGLNKLAEDFGYALGEAEDFFDREEPNVCELIDKVASGQMSARDAKYVWRLVCAKGRDDIAEWRGLRAEVSTDGGFAYLHPSLKAGRVIALLPDSVA